MFLNMFGILIEMGKRSAFSKKDSAFECPSGKTGASVADKPRQKKDTIEVLFMKTEIMGLRFDNVTMAEAVRQGEAFLDGDRPAVVVTPNAEIAYDATKNSSFCNMLNEADMMLPDGAGVVLASKLRKTPVKEKVAGIDFATRMLAVFARRGTRLFLLGSKPGVAEQAAKKMEEIAPGLVICGTADGYFQDDQLAIEKLRAADAQAVFVCLGSPKQEKFMLSHRSELPEVRLMAGLGGSLDGFAGNVKRAPKWMIRLQLEWLYRLCREPKRIGRMMRLPKYICKAVFSRKQNA